MIEVTKVIDGSLIGNGSISYLYVHKSNLDKLIEDLKKVQEEFKAEDARKTLEKSYATVTPNNELEALRKEVEALKSDVLQLKKKEPLTIDILKTLKEGTLIIGTAEESPDFFIKYDDFTEEFLVEDLHGEKCWVDSGYISRWRLA